jgi:hypothetical protein
MAATPLRHGSGMISELMLAALAATGGDEVLRYVRVLLDVSADGRAVGCTVTQTNAPPDLAAKTCDVYRDKAHFTPKRDATGRAVPGRVQATVNYQVPATPAAAAPDPTKALPALPPLAPNGRTFNSLRWTGACWKSSPDDAHYVRCEGRDLEPDTAVTVIRTREGLSIAITVPARAPPNDVATMKLPAAKISEKDPAGYVETMMAVATFVGNGNCPAFPSIIPHDKAGLASFLQATGPLISP